MQIAYSFRRAYVTQSRSAVLIRRRVEQSLCSDK